MATGCTCHNRVLGSKKGHDKNCPQRKSRTSEECSLHTQPWAADPEELRRFLVAQKESWRARRAAEADSALAQQAKPNTSHGKKRKLADEELDDLNAAENKAEAELREALCDNAASAEDPPPRDDSIHEADAEGEDTDDEDAPHLCLEFVTVGNSHVPAEFIVEMIEEQTLDPEKMDDILKMLKRKDLAGDALVARFSECDDDVPTFVDALLEPERGNYVCTLCNEAPYVGADMLSCDRCRVIVCLKCAEGEVPEQDETFYCSECIADLERFVSDSDSEDGYGEVGASSDDDDDDDCDTDDSEAEFYANCLKRKKAGDEDGLKKAEKARAKKLKKREQHLFKPSDSDDSDDDACDGIGTGMRHLKDLVDRNAAKLITSKVEEEYLRAELATLQAKKSRRIVCSDDDDATEEEGEEGEKVRA